MNASAGAAADEITIETVTPTVVLATANPSNRARVGPLPFASGELM
jgi:hypothetical protein